MRQNGISPINGNRGLDNRSGGFQSRNSNLPAAPGAHGFNQPSGNTARSNMETRGNFDSSRPGNSANSSPARESGNSNGGGWQKFSPMAPRSSSEQPTGRSSVGADQNRGSYGSSRGPSGYQGSRPGSYPGNQGRPSEGRSYGGSRPPLNMRQPIVTPRSYGGSPYGGRGYSGRSSSQLRRRKVGSELRWRALGT